MTVPTPTAPLMQGRESLTNQRVSTEQTRKEKGRAGKRALSRLCFFTSFTPLRLQLLRKRVPSNPLLSDARRRRSGLRLRRHRTNAHHRWVRCYGHRRSVRSFGRHHSAHRDGNRHSLELYERLPSIHPKTDLGRSAASYPTEAANLRAPIRRIQGRWCAFANSAQCDSNSCRCCRDFRPQPFRSSRPRSSRHGKPRCPTE
jgi:hypothetical protein